MSQVIVRSFDPGKHQDTFAMIETKVDIEKQRVLISGAYGWKHDDYTKAEADISKIHQAQPADHYVCEQNNTGTHVIDSLQNIYNIPVQGITTSLQVKSETVIKKGKTMDKADIVKSVKILKKAGRLSIVKKKTPGLKIFVKQLNSFVKKLTKAGKTTYEAEGDEHDDFIMAFLINMHYVIVNFLKNVVKRMVITKKYKKDLYEDKLGELGSGVPSGARVLSTKIMYPGQFG